MMKWILASSVLIGVVIGLRRLFRGKISAKLQYALWALVLVRLLMPTGMFSVPFSVENVVGVIRSQPIVHDVVTDLQDPGLTYDEAYDEAEKQVLPKKLQNIPLSKLDADSALKVHNRASMLVYLSMPGFVLESILKGIWYIGIAVVGVTFLVSNIKFTKNLRRKRQLLKDEKPRIYTCEDLDTPCLFGLFRPAIYLTPEDAADEQHSAHILAHERTHLKHRDHIWSFLRCVCLALHWYNPLVWIAAILSRQDGELACDEATIKTLGEEQRIPYGETLVQTTCAAKPTTGILGIATTMTGSADAIKQRILRIAQKFKFNVHAFIAVLLVGAVSIGCTWFGAVPLDNEIVTVYLLDQAKTTTYSRKDKVDRIICRYDDNYNLISASGLASYEYDENNRLLYKADQRLGGGYAEYIYNSQGQIIQCNEHYSDSYIYTYDDYGRVVRCEGKTGSNRFITDYSYDSDGVLRASRKEYSNGSYGEYRTYNADGNLIKVELIEKGKLYCRTMYTYDSFGRVVNSSRYENNNSGTFYNNYNYSYDIAGRLIMAANDNEGSVVKDPSMLLTAPETYTFRYDLLGNMVEMVSQIKGSDQEHRSTFTYDINGRITRCQIAQFLDYRYTYDANGNILTESSYSQNGELMYMTTYSYIPVQVTRKEAERLLAQQDTIIDFLFESYPPNPMPAKEEFYP